MVDHDEGQPGGGEPTAPEGQPAPSPPPAPPRAWAAWLPLSRRPWGTSKRDPAAPSRPWAAWFPAGVPRLRLISIALAMLGLVAVTGVNVYLILRSSKPVAVADAVDVQVNHPAEAAESATPPVEKPEASAAPDAGAAPEAEPPVAEEDPPKPKGDAPTPGRALTVYQASSRSCSTSSVDGLSRQIIAQGRCTDASAFTAVPARPNLVIGAHVLLYLEAPARDHLLKVLSAHPNRNMVVHSALRTVAQQYLLARWANEKRCGIQLAAPPGESNHETGLALDIGDPGTWRPSLEQEGFSWLGSIDRVHFDFKGPGATPHDGLDVLAFQQLWNRNHNDDRIAETGRYSAETEIRLKKSPANGFPVKPRCEARGGGGSPSHLGAR